jgi:endonuclease/exonuclease/phosphatase family metal-dependent hydrolase
VRLVTFNLWNGRSRSDRRVVLERVAAAIAVLSPDVLGLQEVDLLQARSHHADLTAIAAEAMGAVDSRFVAALDGTPGARWVAATDDGSLEQAPEQACYGIALLSRLPVDRWDVLRLPTIGPHFALPLPRAAGGISIGEEPRSVIMATLRTPAGPLAVANTHLSFLPGWNLNQLRRIARHLRGTAGAAVIMGDLNLPAGLPAAVTGFRRLAQRSTFPVGRPVVQLDHILLRGDLGEVQHAEAVALPVSDHRALVVDIDMPSSQ